MGIGEKLLLIGCAIYLVIITSLCIAGFVFGLIDWWRLRNPQLSPMGRLGEQLHRTGALGTERVELYVVDGLTPPRVIHRHRSAPVLRRRGQGRH